MFSIAPNLLKTWLCPIQLQQRAPVAEDIVNRHNLRQTADKTDVLACLHHHRLMLKMFLPPLRHVPSAQTIVTKSPPAAAFRSAGFSPLQKPLHFLVVRDVQCQGPDRPHHGGHVGSSQTTNMDVNSYACAVLLPFLWTLAVWQRGFYVHIRRPLLPRDKFIVVCYLLMTCSKLFSNL